MNNYQKVCKNYYIAKLRAFIEYKNSRRINKFEDLPKNIQEFILDSIKHINNDVYLFGSYMQGDYADGSELSTYYRKMFNKKLVSDIDIMIKDNYISYTEGILQVHPFNREEPSMLIKTKTQ